MEWLFRRHFWIVHLAFLALTAIILASAVNIYLEYWLTNAPLAVEKTSTQRISRIASRDFTAANERNLFDAKRDPPSASPDHKFGATCDQWWNSVQSSLQVRLAGTAVFENSRDSLAIIQDLRRGTAVESYSINECPANLNLDTDLLGILGPTAAVDAVPCNRFVDGATIKRIETDCVYFYNSSSNQCEFIALGAAQCESSGASARPVASPVPQQPKVTPGPAGQNQDLGKSIKKTGGNSFEIEGSDLDNILSNLSVLFTQARTVPAFEGGKPVGFKFVSILPNSVFAKIGFEKGDILTSINGYEMSADKASQLLQKLQTDGQFNVQGKRGGVNFSYEYNIKR